MKFVTYLAGNEQVAGILAQDAKSVHALAEAGIAYGDGSLLQFIKQHTAADRAKLEALAQTPGTPLETVRLLAPIPRPDHNIICLGANYMDHVGEMHGKGGRDLGERKEAIYFSKYVTTAVGPEGTIENHAGINKGLDYEAELAVVMGRDARNVRAEDAWQYVFGLVAFNDISAREIQTKHQQWFFGKSLDTATAFGPWIVTADEFTYPLALRVQCRVNGETRQDNNTQNMIFPLDYAIGELSGGITLEAGTIIATGTPSGVGAASGRFLQPGDVVEVEVEGCGVLRNYVE